MNFRHLPYRQQTFAFALLWFFNGGVSAPSLTQIQPSGGVVNILSLAFRPPIITGRGTPGPQTRRGTGTSAPCELAGAGEGGALMALVPNPTDANGNDINRYTLDANPTFWVYVPFQISNKLHLKFVLLDPDTKKVKYENYLAPNETLPGVVAFHLPSALSLEINKEYSWKFIVECDRTDTIPPETTPPSTSKILVKSTIMRIQPTPELAAALSAAQTILDKAKVYSNYGIWYDTVTTLGNLYREHPTDNTYQREWEELLRDDDVNEKDEGLAQIVGKPIVNCCTPVQN